MSEEQAIIGVIFAHGTMAEGLASAVSKISGIEDALVPISNEGKGPDSMMADLSAAVCDRPAIIFTDLPSGSCAMTALVSCKNRGLRTVVCGVNLPVLLDFVFHRSLPMEELVQRLVEKGRESIRSLP